MIPTLLEATHEYGEKAYDINMVTSGYSIYDNSYGMGEEQLILHIEDGKTVCLWQLEWFKNANIIIPHHKIM